MILISQDITCCTKQSCTIARSCHVFQGLQNANELGKDPSCWLGVQLGRSTGFACILLTSSKASCRLTTSAGLRSKAAWIVPARSPLLPGPVKLFRSMHAALHIVQLHVVMLHSCSNPVPTLPSKSLVLFQNQRSTPSILCTGHLTSAMLVKFQISPAMHEELCTNQWLP